MEGEKEGGKEERMSGKEGEGRKKERGQVERMGRDGVREEGKERGKEVGGRIREEQMYNRNQSCPKVTSHLPLQRFRETMKCKFSGTVGGLQWST